VISSICSISYWRIDYAGAGVFDVAGSLVTCLFAWVFWLSAIDNDN
jgi:hypothetical protein